MDPPQTVIQLPESVSRVAWVPNKPLLTVASCDGYISHLDYDGTQVASAPIKRPGTIWCLAYAPDGHTFAVTVDGTIQIWKADLSSMMEYPQTCSCITGLAWAPDGSQIVAVSSLGRICIWSAALDSERAITPPARGSDRVASVAYAPDGSQFVTAGATTDICIWSPQGALRRRLQNACAYESSVDYCPTGRFFLTIGPDQTLDLWRPDGTPIRRIATTSKKIQEATYTPTGSHIVSTDTSSDDAMLWDVDGSASRPIAASSHALEVIRHPDGTKMGTRTNNRLLVWRV